MSGSLVLDSLQGLGRFGLDTVASLGRFGVFLIDADGTTHKLTPSRRRV